jgi:hypothetical protein
MNRQAATAVMRESLRNVLRNMMITAGSRMPRSAASSPIGGDARRNRSPETADTNHTQHPGALPHLAVSSPAP